MTDEPEANHPLRTHRRPAFEIGDDAVRLVDLFCGCGGLTLGVAQAAHDAGLALDVPLAIDFDADAANAYALNFPKATVYTCRVEEHFDGDLGAAPSFLEESVRDRAGDVTFLVGGPPCQGHSDLNNHTRRNDPKNALYARMARAAEILEPAVVLIENVPAVRHDKNAVVTSVTRHLEDLGYVVADAVLRLEQLGVPQRRRRHVLLGTNPRSCDKRANAVLDDVMKSVGQERDLRWAIGDLAGLSSGSGIDQAPRATSTNHARMTWLLEHDQYDLPNAMRPPCHQNEHSYKSMYGRLRWTEPAQTITSGFGSIGQGRYMHPDLPRALTPHEAARIQGYPDYFQFSELTKRGSLATMIGNSVPPQLSYEVFRRLLPGLRFTLEG